MFILISKKSRNLIAIGNKLLRVWGMLDVYDAAQAYEGGRIKFDATTRTVQLGEGRKLRCRVSDISSVVGDLSLCTVQLPTCSTEDESEYLKDIVDSDIDENYDKNYSENEDKSFIEIQKEEQFEEINSFIDLADKEVSTKIEKSKKDIKKDSKKTVKIEHKDRDIDEVENKTSKDDDFDFNAIFNELNIKNEDKDRDRDKEDKKTIEHLTKQGATPQPKDMEIVLDGGLDKKSKKDSKYSTESKSKKKEKEKNRSSNKKSEDDFNEAFFKDNSEAINLNTLLMEDSKDDIIVDSSKERETKSSTNREKESLDFELDSMFNSIDNSEKKDSKSEDDFDLDAFLYDDLNVDKNKKSIDKESKKKSSKKSLEESDSLDDFSLDNLVETKTKETKKETEIDDFSLDDLFNDIESTPQESKSKTENRLKLDSELDSKKTVKKRSKKEPEPFDDDFNLDTLFDEYESGTKSRTSQKKDKQIKKLEDNKAEEINIDFDIDALFDNNQTNNGSKIEEVNIDFDIDALFNSGFDDNKKVESKPKKAKKESSLSEIDDFDLDSLFDDDSGNQKHKPEKIESNISSFADKTTTKNVKKEPDLRWKELIKNFDIDIVKNAERIEFPVEDYEELIEDFIGNSKDMENELRFGSQGNRASAIKALKDAISMLHLHPLDKLLEEMLKVEDDRDNMNKIIDAFYKILDDIKEKIKASRAGKASQQSTHDEHPTIEIRLNEPNSIQTPKVEETEVVEDNKSGSSSISVNEFLKDVRMIPIEFSIKLAADELNLPEDLVLEFVNDFSNQGHEYIPELIDAYQNGDLDKLQKTAHMLKGAASNLRIEPMVQNLYDLQFDNDLSRAPRRIKLFAGQLISLDQYLKQVNNS